MFEIQPVEVDLPAALEPKEEVNSIVKEYMLGHALREVSLFRVWRLWRDDEYSSILSDDPSALPGQPQFAAFNDFLKFLTQNLDVSRSKVYSRLKTYSLLTHLGYSEKEMVGMMATKPGLYEKVINAIFLWDQESRAATGMKTDAFGSSPYGQETIDNVRDFISELEAHNSVGDAISRLMHDVLGKPKISLRVVGGAIVVDYTTTIIDGETMEELTGDSGSARFECADDVPEWVLDYLAQKYGAK